MDDLRIDEAINSIPLVDLPEGFVARTMERIIYQRGSIPFRFQFIDFALPAFFSIFLLVFIGIGWWGYDQINPQWFQYWQYEIIHSLKSIPLSLRLMQEGILMSALVLLMLISLIIIWVVGRPRYIQLTR